MFPPRWPCWNSERVESQATSVDIRRRPALRTSVISRLPQLTSDVIHTRRYVHALCQIVCEFDTQRNVLLASH